MKFFSSTKLEAESVMFVSHDCFHVSRDGFLTPPLPLARLCSFLSFLIIFSFLFFSFFRLVQAGRGQCDERPAGVPRGRVLPARAPSAPPGACQRDPASHQRAVRPQQRKKKKKRKKKEKGIELKGNERYLFVKQCSLTRET